jgi:hypothetical protein
MVHQELIRAATLLAVLLVAFVFFMKPEREARQLKHDCGMIVEPSRITDEMRQACANYVRETQKYK